MLILATVKRTLLVSLGFLLLIIVMAAVLAAFSVLIGTGDARVRADLPRIGIGAVVLAVLFSMRRASGRAVVPAVYLGWTGLIVTVVVAGIVLAHQFVLLPDLPDRALGEVVATDVILHGSRHSLVVGEATDTQVRDVIVISHNGQTPAIRYGVEGIWNRVDQQLTLSGGLEIDAHEIDGLGRTSQPRALSATIGDIDRLTAHFMASARDSILIPVPWGQLFARVLAFSVAVTMTWTAIRFSRWPLINAVLALLYLRLVVAVPTLSARFGLEMRVSAVIPPIFVPFTTTSVWLLIALIMALVLIPLPRFGAWRREMDPQGARS